MGEIPGFWTTLGTSILLFFVAAKSHGRQLRLEREVAGYDHVVFGGNNPQFVEDLWRKDRVQYWRLFAVLMILSIAVTVSLHSWDFLILSCIWTFAAAFTVVGISSFVRFKKSLKIPYQPSEGLTDPRSKPDWEKQAVRGSLGWWFAVVALSSLIGILALRNFS